MSSAGASIHIIRAHVIDLMAEVACASADNAYAIIARFPDYRSAKDDPGHPFWVTSAFAMRDSLVMAVPDAA